MTRMAITPNRSKENPFGSDKRNHSMNKMNMQIRGMRRRLPFKLLLVAALILAFQHAPASESGPPGKVLNEPLNEVPAKCFDRSFESFAPTVKKVAPAVVRIVTALNSNNPADLTSVPEEPLQSYVSGQMPQIRSGLSERGLGSLSLIHI